MSKLQGIRFLKLGVDTGQVQQFHRLIKIFRDIFLATSGDIPSSLAWMNELDRRYRIFSSAYRLPDFIKDLKDQGFIKEKNQFGTGFQKTEKLEKSIRMDAFQDLFGKMNKSRPGKHLIEKSGKSDEQDLGFKPFEFGDSYSRILPAESLRNTLNRTGNLDGSMEASDWVLFDTLQQTQCCTVLLIDISHSMILYGEDRITPAKRVALALAQMIHQYYPNDQLHVAVFGDHAHEIPLTEIPYIEVGPFHTNTVEGLQLAMHLLSKSRCSNKNIMMITDGKPSCIRRGKELYKNPYGLDPYIIDRTLSLARKCKKQNIQVTTFMVSDDAYLIEFVEAFSKEANGQAYYTQLNHLGQQILFSYQNNRKKRSS